MMRLPGTPFFLLGMGGREKVLYRAGALLDPTTGEVIRQWEVRSERVEPAAYAVHLETTAGKRVSIFEDEEACWLETEGQRGDPVSPGLLAPAAEDQPRKKGGLPIASQVTRRVLSRGHVNLPTFAGHRYAQVLRVLHQEMLVNIRVPALRAGAPLPNLIVYDKPWYRDAAMVCMCLEKTGNLHLVRDWILGLREPFDRNNASTCEPDNLGQALYLISLVANASHPLVKVILEEVEKFRTGDYIVGSTDSGQYPVYQTKWLKFGLRALGLPDPFQIPPVFDPYSALFWMDYREQHVPGPRFKQMSRERYPYLGWAEDHFYGDPPGRVPASPMRAGGGLVYPLTWEAFASEAKYEKMAVVSEEYVNLKLAAPHTWHAAEMFLRLLECE
jgi:hypothetical protein